MKSEIKRLIKFLPEEYYERVLILLSQDDYYEIHKIATTIKNRMQSLIDILDEEVLIEESEDYV